MSEHDSRQKQATALKKNVTELFMAINFWVWFKIAFRKRNSAKFLSKINEKVEAVDVLIPSLDILQIYLFIFLLIGR